MPKTSSFSAYYRAVVIVLAGLAAAQGALADSPSPEKPCVQTDAAAPVPKSVLDTLQPAIDVQLQIGSLTGVQGSLVLLKNQRVDVALEGFAGVAVLSPAYGGGARAEIKAVQGKNNALVIGPGVDLYSIPTVSNSFFSPAAQEYLIDPNVDVKWLHQFAAHFGIELGARVGYGIIKEDGQSDLRTNPTVSVITGMRF